jgi:tetratricopeptide (TPR) repeat protein
MPLSIRPAIARALLIAALAGASSCICPADRADTAAALRANALEQQIGLAEQLFASGRYTEGLDLALRLQQSVRSTYGETSTAYGVLMNVLGAAQSNLGHYDDAIEAMKQAAAAFQASLGSQAVLTAKVFANLGEACKRARRYGDAESYFKQAIAIQERQHNGNDPDLAWSLNGLGAVYIEQARYPDADQLLRLCSPHAIPRQATNQAQRRYPGSRELSSMPAAARSWCRTGLCCQPRRRA